MRNTDIFCVRKHMYNCIRNTELQHKHFGISAGSGILQNTLRYSKEMLLLLFFILFFYCSGIHIARKTSHFNTYHILCVELALCVCDKNLALIVTRTGNAISPFVRKKVTTHSLQLHVLCIADKCDI